MVAWAKWAGERECLQFIQGLPSPHHTTPSHTATWIMGGGGRRTKPISSPLPSLLLVLLLYTYGKRGAVGRLEFFLLLSSLVLLSRSYVGGSCPVERWKLRERYFYALGLGEMDEWSLRNCGEMWEGINRPNYVSYWFCPKWLLASFRNTLLWPLKVTQMDDEKAVCSRYLPKAILFWRCQLI